ncbi:MAG: hypothetical protein HC905_17155, partial [Bacteroidales bacterium]|nr:hypothetical protein [Bacteroidales bacterium]
MYKVVATNGATSCSATLTDQSTVTVNPLPDITYTLSDPTICNGSTATITQSGSEAGVNYQLQLVSTSANVGAAVAGTGAPITFSVSPSATTLYKVVATNGATSCSATLTDQSTVTVNPLPNITYTLSDPTICNGSTATITQSGSEAGVDYQLQLVSTSANVGAAVAGTGAPIAFSVSPSATTLYKVVATNGATSCSATLTDQSTVTVNPLPVITYTLSDPTICNGTTATITQSGSEAGVDYQLQLVSTSANIGAAVAGTGNPITFTVSPSANTQYKVVATNGATTCSATLTDLSTVTVNPLPDITYTLSDPTICEGTTATITQSASEAGVNYQLQLVSTSANVGAAVAGTGAPITYTVSPSATTQYKVVATNGITTCSEVLTDESTVTVNPLPTLFNITGGGNYCAGDPGVQVGLSNSEPGVDYELYLNGVATGNILPGTGANLDFGNQVLAGNYTIMAINTITSCEVLMTGTAAIVVNPLPNNTLAVSDPEICEGTNAVIEVTASELNTEYQLRLNSDNSLIGSPVAGTGNTISFTVSPVVSADYNILASKTDGTGCYIQLTDLAEVIVNPAVTVAVDPNTPVICTGENLTFDGNPAGGTGAFLHSWTGTGASYLSDVNIQNPVFSSTLVGNYSLTYTATDSKGCFTS